MNKYIRISQETRSNSLWDEEKVDELSQVTMCAKINCNCKVTYYHKQTFKYFKRWKFFDIRYVSINLNVKLKKGERERGEREKKEK